MTIPPGYPGVEEPEEFKEKLRKLRFSLNDPMKSNLLLNFIDFIGSLKLLMTAD